MRALMNKLLLFLFFLSGLSAVHAEVTITYYHTDALGSVIGSSDDAGNLLWTESYYPHGAPRENSVASQSDDIRYTGKQYDSAMGLSYYGGRYYNPEIGRFMSMDPVSALDTVSSNPQLFNRYVYANNNPYKFVDPGGDLPILVPLYFAYKGLSVAADVVDVAVNIQSGNVVSAVATIVGALDPTGLTNKLKKINKVPKGKGQTFERVVSNAELKATEKTGLLRGGREGENFFTNKASLDAKRAQQRLGLDGPLRDSRIQFRIKNNVEVTGPRRAAPGQTGAAGGGREFSTNGRTEIEILRVDPLRK